ncbi:MAG: GAF domain-containing protein, partial [Micromonosporaceae bacterium]|nr:GAF domain-containing protein [Micromonosporaceae bacterium]
MGVVPGIEFLELLAREAATVEFEGPLLHARGRGVSAETLAELERAKLLALRVRALLEQRRRREVELSSLFDTASDLAGLRDLDAVLTAITHRARQLLSADITYMTLGDEERGDTCMRVTDGSISARFQQLRLPLGGGLGGLVAESGTPYVTADYLADDRFKHLDEIDKAVIEEGLVAILGVPMRLGTRVIGVLFAANRSARPFAREEVALLCSLANHAAVAIDTARLLEETQSALEELSAANTVIRAHSESVERAAEAHDRMTAQVLRGGGVEDVAAAVADVLGGALRVLDASGRQIAAVGDVDSAHSGILDEAVAASRAEGRAVRRGEIWVAAVIAGTERLGALVMRPEADLADADQRILERAALVTALLLLFDRTVAEAEGRVRGELLGDLITAADDGGRRDAVLAGQRPTRDPESLRQRARLLQIDLDAPQVLLAADVRRSHRERAGSWAASFASAQGGLAVTRGNRIAMMLPGEEAGAAARRVSRDLGVLLGTPVTVGSAGPVEGPDGIAAVFQEADQCADALLALGRAGQAASTRDLGFVGLLLSAQRDARRFVADAIGPVIEYDERRGTALIATLEAYFGAGGSLSRAAEVLHVHVNTVAQRLERVSQLLGEHWQQPDTALEVQLALRLHRLGGTAG